MYAQKRHTVLIFFLYWEKAQLYPANTFPPIYTSVELNAVDVFSLNQTLHSQHHICSLSLCMFWRCGNLFAGSRCYLQAVSYPEALLIPNHRVWGGWPVSDKSASSQPQKTDEEHRSIYYQGTVARAETRIPTHGSSWHLSSKPQLF